MNSVNNIQYVSPSPGRIPIIAQDSIPGQLMRIIGGDIDSLIKGYYVNGEVFKDVFSDVMLGLAEAGFNTIISNGGNTVKFWLCQEASVYNCMVIIYSPTFGDSIINAEYDVEKFSQLPGFYGWNVKDEPIYSDWGDAFYEEEDNLNPKWNYLTYAMNYARQLAPDNIAYFNLQVPGKDNESELNNFAKKIIGSCNSYEQYLHILQRLYCPKLWSYDFYPFRINNSEIDWINSNCREYKSTHLVGNKLEERVGITGYLMDNPYFEESKMDDRFDDFYKTLDRFRIHSQKTSTPFWAYCMCIGHGSISVIDGVENLSFYYPIPTIGQLRFEAFSALAFGAQGIVYWEYAEQQPATDVTKEYMFHTQGPLTSRIIDSNGVIISPADRNNKVNYVNTRVKDVKLIYNQVWGDVKVVNSEIQKYADVFLGSTCKKVFHVNNTYGEQNLYQGPLHCLGQITCSRKGVLVTSLENENGKYIIIVSHDAFNEQEIRLVLKAGHKGVILSDSLEYEFNNKLSNEIIVIRALSPGGCIIIKWEKLDSNIGPIGPIYPTSPIE